MVPGRRPVDLFRCESATLKSHWVMVVIDQFTRRIIGFAVHAGDCDGIAYCRMFNQIIAGKSLPKYLSSDNDPAPLSQHLPGSVGDAAVAGDQQLTTFFELGACHHAAERRTGIVLMLFKKLVRIRVTSPVAVIVGYRASISSSKMPS